MLNRTFIASIVIIAVLALALAISGCSAVQTAQEFNKTGNAFMTALKDAKYAAAYALFVPELQQKVGQAADLQKMIEDNRAQPSQWSFTSFNPSTDKNKTQTTKVEGSVTYQEGRKGAVTLEMIKVGEEWKLTSFNLTW
jgi:type II secretory pathway pseudopilin PulG